MSTSAIHVAIERDYLAASRSRLTDWISLNQSTPPKSLVFPTSSRDRDLNNHRAAGLRKRACNLESALPRRITLHMIPIAERQKPTLLQYCGASYSLILSDHNSRGPEVVRTKTSFIHLVTKHGPDGVKKQGMSALSTAQDQGELE